MCVRIGPRYKWVQRWNDVNCRTGVALPTGLTPTGLHPVSAELENSGIRVAVGDCSVTERRRWRPAKLFMYMQITTNTTRTDARRRVCAAMVPYH